MERKILLLLFLLLTVTGVEALPTLNGPSGLVALPDALLSSSRLALVGSVAENPGVPGVTLDVLYRMTGVEAGALYARDDENMVGANAKASFATGLYDSTGALGGIYLKTDSTTERCLYLAVTRPGTLSLTGGLTWTEIRTGAGHADALRPYVGAKLALPGEMTVVAELQQKSKTFMEPHEIFSFMIVRGSGMITTTIGTTNALGLLGAENHFFFSGICLSYGN